MKPKYLILVAGITAALSCGAFAQQDEKLGKLSFPTSCDPKVQAEFERGVAMLHSYWFIYARRTFEGVLQQDPTCAIAYWGVAMDYLGNTLATTPTQADARAAWDALEKARAAGAKTQVTGVVGAIVVALLLVCAPNLLKDLPSSALAAVVIAAAIGLFEFADLRRIFRIQQWEFWLSIVCLVGVAVFGAIPGIGLAVVIAVIEFLWDGWRPHFAVLGRAEGVKGYHDITRYPDARQIPGLVLFRWDAPLFFANAGLFKERVLDAAKQSPTAVRWLVVAAEPVTSVDVTSADALVELDETLHESGVKLCFAELKDPVKDKLKRFGLFSRFGEASFFPTIGAAVGSYLDCHAVDWIDWEDRSPPRNHRLC